MSLVGTIICNNKSCAGKELMRTVADSYREMCFAVEAMLIAAHAGGGHCQHNLSLKIEGEPAGVEKRTLSIECLHVQCNKRRAHGATLVDVPIELVGANVIIFHAAHEGHKLKITYGDRVWESPG